MLDSWDEQDRKIFLFFGFVLSFTMPHPLEIIPRGEEASSWLPVLMKDLNTKKDEGYTDIKLHEEQRQGSGRVQRWQQQERRLRVVRKAPSSKCCLSVFQHTATFFQQMMLEELDNVGKII